MTRSPAPRPAHTVLGVSADYHDAAAALVVDGVVRHAAAEERFTRVKHDASLPRHAIAWCLEAGGVAPGELDHVAFYDKPLTAYERTLVTHAQVGPAGVRSLTRSLATFGRTRLWAGYRIERCLRALGHPMPPLSYAEHHQSHAAAAFWPSPHERAAVLTFDGVGEWATASIAHGRGSTIDPIRELRFPDSLGLLYSTVTAHCGFEVNDGEYKLMGLAPYGRPRFADVMRRDLVAVADDGSFRLDQRRFGYLRGDRMGSRRLDDLFDGPPAPLGAEPTQREADLARSMQVVLEDIVLRMAATAYADTGEDVACLGGGVALNCVANRRLLDDGPFRDVWVQPAAGDDGSAAGAALWAYHQQQSTAAPSGSLRPRSSSTEAGDGDAHADDAHDGEALDGDTMSGAALGPAYADDDISAWLAGRGVAHERPDDEALLTTVAAAITDGAIVGWFDGPMEFGPRALGHRSILADPRDPAMVRTLNLAVKGREGFRPFAPAVPVERAAAWFGVDRPFPYMTFTAPVLGAEPSAPVDTVGAPGTAEVGFAERLGSVRSPLPACTHVDGSARVQTVDRATHPRFWALLDRFGELTGCPVLVNTSFNRRGEPIVRTPADALRCAEAAGLDLLVLGGCLVHRSDLTRDVRLGEAATCS